MNRLFVCLTLICLPCSLFAQGEDPDEIINPKLVAVRIAVLESSEELQLKDDANLSTASLNEMVARLRDQNALDSYQFFNLASIENQEAMIQFGQEENVIVGRSYGPPSRGGNSGSFAGDAGRNVRTINSYQREETGSMIQVVSKVREDGQILVQLNVTCSRFKAEKPAEAAEESGEVSVEVNSPKKKVLTCQTTVLLAPGVTTVIAAGGNDHANASSRDYIIVSATAK